MYNSIVLLSIWLAAKFQRLEAKVGLPKLSTLSPAPKLVIAKGVIP